MNTLLRDSLQQIVLYDTSVALHPGLWLAVREPTQQAIFLTGVAGTGKSYNLRAAIQWLTTCQPNGSVAITSTTGKSAVAIGGTTIHRWAMLYGDQEQKYDDRIAAAKKAVAKMDSGQDEKTADRIAAIRRCRYVLLDEISILGCEYLNALDTVLRIYRRMPTQLMGGLRFIFTGDVLQLPPIGDGWFFLSRAWRELSPLILTLRRPYRFANRDFFQLLCRVRQGRQTPDDVQILRRCRETRQLRIQDLEHPIITPKLDFVKKVNADRLAALKTPEFVFHCVDSTVRKRLSGATTRANRVDTKTAELFDKSVEREIFLKVGAKVMLNVNLSISCGLVNGVVGEVMGIITDPASGVPLSVSVRFTLTTDGGSTTKESVEIVEPYEYQIKEREDNTEIIHKRYQIPLTLAWALTIHKCQGATLDNVYVYIKSNDWIERGMVFVVLSRVRTLAGLHLLTHGDLPVKIDPTALRYSLENNC
jgi:ATP-dependent DNA helicase PIF1